MSTMTWRSFQKLCRGNAERVPYHPEAFLQDAPSRAASAFVRPFRGARRHGRVLVVAVAAVLLSSLSVRRPSPPVRTADPLFPPRLSLPMSISSISIPVLRR